MTLSAIWYDGIHQQPVLYSQPPPTHFPSSFSPLTENTVSKVFCADPFPRTKGDLTHTATRSDSPNQHIFHYWQLSHCIKAGSGHRCSGYVHIHPDTFTTHLFLYVLASGLHQVQPKQRINLKMQLSHCSVDYENRGIRKQLCILQCVMMHIVRTHIYGCTCYSFYSFMLVYMFISLYIRFILHFCKDIYSQLLYFRPYVEWLFSVWFFWGLFFVSCLFLLKSNDKCKI